METALIAVQWANTILDEVGLAPIAIVAGAFRWLFGKARRFSPGTGLAVGYYENFLEPVLATTRGAGGLAEVLLWMPPARDWAASRSRFDTMSAAAGEGRSQYVSRAVQTQMGPRTLLVTESGGRRIGLDLPRTLTPVLSQLVEVPAGRLLRKLGTADAIQRRELRNFWEALMARIEADTYHTSVRVFCGDPESAPEQARPLTDWESMCDRAIPKPHPVLRALGF